MAGTGIVSLNSELVRKGWMAEGLIEKASKSFWAPYIGGSSDSIVYQETDISAKEGHTVVFDYSGKLSGSFTRGKDTVYGTGEVKRKYSDKITVDRYRKSVDNGDKFDGVNIGDLTINEHTDSRSKLTDLTIRFKDQMLFDAAQGCTGYAPSHIYKLTAGTFTYNDTISISEALESGEGFKAPSATGAVSAVEAAQRAPLEPFLLEDGEPVWLFIVDTKMATKLKLSSGYQTIMQSADIRGNKNRLIKQAIGKLGPLLIVEAKNFFGYTSGTGTTFGFEDSEVERSGLRQYYTSTAGGTTLSGWKGQSTFGSAADQTVSRGLILGQGALQLGMGKMPNYRWQESTDFGITSESAVELWTEAKPCILTLEAGAANKAAKITDISYGIIAVDMFHA